MSKYIMQFSKEGMVRYISHLDLMRNFQRAFKRTGVQLAYSQGFNPHPRMSLAQPLSLGYSSVGEYLEFETKEAYSTEMMAQKMNQALPKGITVLACKEQTHRIKPLASLVFWGSYEILYHGDNLDLIDKTHDFINRSEILVMKKTKSGQMKQQDIRPMISELKAIKKEGFTGFYTLIRVGSEAYLNPETLIQAYFSDLNLPYDKSCFTFKRLGLFDSERNPLITLL